MGRGDIAEQKKNKSRLYSVFEEKFSRVYNEISGGF